LPHVLGYAGLLIAVMTYAIGGGITDVLLNPIADALPKGDNAASMSLVHSFYCWGHVAVVLLTTLAMRVIGADAWPVLPVLWAAVPLINAYRFAKVPIVKPAEEKLVSVKALLFNRFFLLALILMIASGASELAMSQWVSLFAEKGLRVSKVLGDLLGPCLFAVFMGTGRVLFGKYGQKINIQKALSYSAVLCILCYAVASISLNPLVALAGCALTGLSVSLMWPGMVSFSARRFTGGGTAMFSLLAMGGHIGCSIGPWMTGVVSAAAENWRWVVSIGERQGLDAMQTGLKSGLLLAAIFPLALLIGMFLFRRAEVEKN